MLIVSVLALKLTFLALDSLPLFFLGDSAAYLHSAVMHSVPSDRSFTYGWLFIRPILATFGKLQVVVTIQTLLAAATAILAAVCLRVGFQAPLWVAAVAALLYAVEPLALIQERLILTETLTLFVLAWFVLAGLCYINRPRASLLIALAFLGTCVLSLRSFYIPIVFVSTVATVLLGIPRLRRQTALSSRGLGSRFLLHALVAVGATVSFHALYQYYFSYMTNQPPSYNSGAGFFLLSSWAPVVTQDDFPSREMAERVLPNLKFSLQDRQSRPAQQFVPGGLISLLFKEQDGEARKTNQLAKTIALHAGLRDPIGVMKLAWQSYTDFWDRDKMEHSLVVDQGHREMDQGLLDHFKTRYSEDLSGHHLQDTLAKRWHRAAISWYRILLLSPIFSLLLCIPRAHREQTISIGILACAVIVVATALGTVPTVRYLHALGWITCLQLGILLCHLRAAWTRERADFMTLPLASSGNRAPEP